MKTQSGSSLEGLARDLARDLTIGGRQARHGEFVRRITSVRNTMAAVARTLSAAKDGAPSGAAEWLIDNRYIVMAALKQVERDMPSRFLSRLPTTGAAREPRISLLAGTISNHSEGHVEPDTALRFLDGYQRVSELTTAELWALPTFLRLAVLEDLATQCTEIVRPGAPSSDAQARLHDRVAACIGSLRIFATHDWKVFFESASLVERRLREGDPSGVYVRMDFATRDAYRTIIETVARRTGTPESRVAELALQRAASDECPSGHVGFALQDQGIALEGDLGYEPPVWAQAVRSLKRAKPAAYFLGILLGAAALTVGIALPLSEDPGMALAAFVVGFIPALSVSVSVVN
ncbi:MAG: hypothetical protein OEO23_06920, partial [Gemmatimonadota bacterium]|nr:hypothetical protein [Gemmatimonadota bacterium]